MFAKIFEVDGHQVLATKGMGDCPSVQFSLMPPGLGVCSTGWQWDNDDDGCRSQDEAFNDFDQERATEAARAMLQELGGLMESEGGDGE